MDKNSEIQEELKQWQSPLAELPRSMPFAVPPGYADGAEEYVQVIMKKTKGTVWTKENPYGLESGYFDALPQLLIEKARQAEKKDKRRSIPLPFFARVAAAVLLLATALSGYMYLSSPALAAGQELSKVSDEAVSSYLQQYSDEFDTELIVNNVAPGRLSELGTVEGEEIVNYLEESGWEAGENYN